MDIRTFFKNNLNLFNIYHVYYQSQGLVNSGFTTLFGNGTYIFNMKIKKNNLYYNIIIHEYDINKLIIENCYDDETINNDIDFEFYGFIEETGIKLHFFNEDNCSLNRDIKIIDFKIIYKNNFQEIITNNISISEKYYCENILKKKDELKKIKNLENNEKIIDFENLKNYKYLTVKYDNLNNNTRVFHILKDVEFIKFKNNEEIPECPILILNAYCSINSFDSIYIKNIQITNMKYLTDIINNEKNNINYDKYSLNITYFINNQEINEDCYIIENTFFNKGYINTKY